MRLGFKLLMTTDLDTYHTIWGEKIYLLWPNKIKYKYDGGFEEKDTKHAYLLSNPTNNKKLEFWLYWNKKVYYN